MESISCKTFERQIDDFFDDELENDELAAFLHHAENCEDCREELTIRLLIRIGLQRLEDGRTFHLGNEYDRMMRSARGRLNRRNQLARFASLGVGAVILGVLTVMVISWIILV